MYPTAAAIVDKSVGPFITAAGWKHVAVIYAPADAWGMAVKDRILALGIDNVRTAFLSRESDCNTLSSAGEQC